MGKKYTMFVDEIGFLSKNKNDNITMMGVVFEYDYCIGLKEKECELRIKLNKYKEEIFGKESYNLSLDDIILNEEVYRNISVVERKKFINELPSLFRRLKFTIISCTIKQDVNNVNDSYLTVIKKLLKKFYTFIVENNGESGGIIIEARKEKIDYVKQQKFFNIYNERNKNLSMLDDIQDKINTFIVCEKSSNTFGAGIELSNILTKILYRVSNGYKETDGNLISFMEYGNNDKILDSIKYKIYNNIESGVPRKQLEMASYDNAEIFREELKLLKEQLVLKEIRIKEKEKEIDNLTSEIQLLNKQLKEVLFNRKGDNIISRIFSDIDVKMKRFEEITGAAKN